METAEVEDTISPTGTARSNSQLLKEIIAVTALECITDNKQAQMILQIISYLLIYSTVNLNLPVRVYYYSSIYAKK